MDDRPFIFLPQLAGHELQLLQLDEFPFGLVGPPLGVAGLKTHLFQDLRFIEPAGICLKGGIPAIPTVVLAQAMLQDAVDHQVG